MEPLAVYVHWPFCAAKCPYCDFNSHVRARIDQDQWRRAYAAETAYWAALTPGRLVTSIFLGGGTPSLMEPATVAAILEAIARGWSIARDVEITLEANPGSVESGRFAAYGAAGVNRVSLGVQALDDDALAGLGRIHRAGEALAALEIARRHFPRYSFDLIYARPGQTVDEWQAELQRALALAGDHLSLYQLTLEPGTPFHAAARRGELRLPEEDVQADMYELTQGLCADAGLPAYEVSNHAGAAGASRHNLAYWRYQDYVGIGPGAHGRVTLEGRKLATRAHRAPEIWLERVARDGHGGHAPEPIDPARQLEEALMMGLRLAEGVDAARIAGLAGLQAASLTGGKPARALMEEGLIDVSGTRLTATPAGRQRLNAVIAHLLP